MSPATVAKKKSPLTAAVKNDLIKKINGHVKAIGEHRDALRDIVSDIEEHIDSTGDALELLDEAVDKLSETL